MQGLFEFHGRLQRSDKRPANPGTYALQFQLHGQPRVSQRDKLYWEEVLDKVEVAPGGFFRVVLGKQTAVEPGVFSRGVRWMSVRVLRAGTLDEESGCRVPVVGQSMRLYSAISKLEARLLGADERLNSFVTSAPKVEQFQTRVNRISEAVEGLRSRLGFLEGGTEQKSIIRRVEALTNRLDDVDREDGRIDKLELELDDLVGPDGDVVDLNERMDRVEGHAPELIAALRVRERDAPQQARLHDLRGQIDAIGVQLAEMKDAIVVLTDAGSKKKAGADANTGALAAVKRTGDAMTGGLVIKRGGLEVLSGGVVCRGATVTTLEASNLVRSPKMLTDSFELRGDFTVDSASRSLQVRVIEGRKASARRDGALHLNSRGGAEVVVGNAAAAKGLAVFGTVRSDTLVARSVGGVAQLFHATGNLSAGDVVRVNDTGDRVARIRKKGDPRVMGVITDNPGVLLGGEPRTGFVVVSVTGVVDCRVEATDRPIQAGDLLVGSGLAGHACAVESPERNAVLGKALAPLAKGKGVIAVLLGGG
jgi:hypothetical protein